MSKYNFQITSRNRSTNMSNFLSESSALAIEEKVKLDKEVSEKAKDATFIPNMKSRQSTAVMEINRRLLKKQ